MQAGPRSKATLTLLNCFANSYIASLWCDNVCVKIICTVHDWESQHARLSKKEEKMDANVKVAQHALFSLQETELLIPLCIDDYSHTMGGVYIAVQMPSDKDKEHTTFRTRWPMLLLLYHTMVTNT